MSFMTKLPTAGQDPRLANMARHHDRYMRETVKNVRIHGKVRLPRKRKKVVHRMERANYSVLLTAVMLQLHGRKRP